jgi:glucose/arabinose dehydrogenase
VRPRPLAALLLVALAASAPAGAAPRLAPVGTFTQPVYVTAPPADPHRLFVVERAGVVKVMVDGGAPRPFLDISGEVDSSGGEEGLLSIAFAPDYATSRRLYAYFTARDDTMGNGSRIKIVEFLRSAANPDVADTAPAARRTLIEIAHPTNSNHNGGQLQFGPDGLLYAGTGDGGGGNDPPNNAQNTSSRLGKLLRIDPAAGITEMYAYGLRNPWRFSFDRQTGDLIIGDVGQSSVEEIDFAARGSGAGANYGWRCFEGSIRTPGVPACDPSGHVLPVHEYSSADPAPFCSVTGGYVVRDSTLPTLRGRYLYGDYCNSSLRSMELASPGATDRAEALTSSTTSSFGEDSCGHVYVVSIGGGTVHRVEDQPFTPCPEEPADPGPGPGPGPGEDPPGDPPAGDTTAPVLSVSRARRQKLLRKRAVYIGVGCDEACGVTTEANARLTVRGRLRKYAFPPAGALAAAGQRPRLELRLTKAMRAGLGAAVARGARPLVKVVVIARDSAGNEARRTAYVRVVG